MCVCVFLRLSTDTTKDASCKTVFFHLLQLCKVETTIIELTWKQNPEIINDIKILFTQLMTMGFPGGSDGKESACYGFNPWVWRITLRRAWQSIPVFLPGKSHGQRSLAGYSQWGHKKLDTTERLTHTQWPQDPANHSRVNKKIFKKQYAYVKTKMNLWEKKAQSIKRLFGEESRWRRNRTGRSLSLLQIHPKNRTVNKVYKTTSDR